MSKADEMFLKLEYKKYDNHPEFDKPLEPNMFVTQDVRQLYYEQKGIVNGMAAAEYIYFDLFRKNVVVFSQLNGRKVPTPLNIQELQAINEKVKELGWLNE